MTKKDPNISIKPGRKINVLHLISSFNQGGSEMQAIQLAAQLSKTDGFNVFLATLRNEGSLRAWSAPWAFPTP